MFVCFFDTSTLYFGANERLSTTLFIVNRSSMSKENSSTTPSARMSKKNNREVSIRAHHSKVVHTLSAADVEAMEKPNGTANARVVDFEMWKIACEYLETSHVLEVCVLASTTWTSWQNSNAKSTQHACSQAPADFRYISIPVTVGSTTNGHWGLLIIKDLGHAIDDVELPTGEPETAFFFFDPLRSRKKAAGVEKLARGLAVNLLGRAWHNKAIVSKAPWHVVSVSLVR